MNLEQRVEALEKRVYETGDERQFRLDREMATERVATAEKIEGQQNEQRIEKLQSRVVILKTWHKKLVTLKKRCETEMEEVLAKRIEVPIGPRENMTSQRVDGDQPRPTTRYEETYTDRIHRENLLGTMENILNGSRKTKGPSGGDPGYFLVWTEGQHGPGLGALEAELLDLEIELGEQISVRERRLAAKKIRDKKRKEFISA